MGWLPIESAPKDGPLLLWLGLGCAVGQFGTYESPYGNSEREDGWLIEGDCDCERNPMLGRPTHWMPLPDPPA